MLVYLNQAYTALLADNAAKGKTTTKAELLAAVLQGAGLRVRPIMMTGGTVIVGLLPILYGSGTGSEVMSRIAAPMVGGMASAMLLTLLILPALYYLWRATTLKQ